MLIFLGSAVQMSSSSSSHPTSAGPSQATSVPNVSKAGTTPVSLRKLNSRVPTQADLLAQQLPIGQVCYVCMKKKKDLLKCTNPKCQRRAHTNESCSAYTQRAKTEENLAHSDWFCSGECYVRVNPMPWLDERADNELFVGLAVVDGLIDKRFKVYRDLLCRRQFDVLCLTQTRCFDIDTTSGGRRKTASHATSIDPENRHRFTFYYHVKEYDVHFGAEQSDGGGVVVYTRREEECLTPMYRVVYNERIEIGRQAPINAPLAPLAQGLPSLQKLAKLKPITIDMILLQHVHANFVVGCLYRHLDGDEKGLSVEEVALMYSTLTRVISAVLDTVKASGLILTGTLNYNCLDQKLKQATEDSFCGRMSLEQIITSPTQNIDMTELELQARGTELKGDHHRDHLRLIHDKLTDSAVGSDGLRIFHSLEKLFQTHPDVIKPLALALQQRDEHYSAVCFCIGYLFAQVDTRKGLEPSQFMRKLPKTITGHPSVSDEDANEAPDYGYSDVTALKDVPSVGYTNLEIQDYEIREFIQDYDENHDPTNQEDVDSVFEVIQNLGSEEYNPDSSTTFLGLDVDDVGGSPTDHNKTFWGLNEREDDTEAHEAMRNEVAMNLDEAYNRAVDETNTNLTKQQTGKFATIKKAAPEMSDMIFMGPSDLFECELTQVGHYTTVERRIVSKQDTRHAVNWCRLRFVRNIDMETDQHSTVTQSDSSGTPIMSRSTSSYGSRRERRTISSRASSHHQKLEAQQSVANEL